MINLVPKRRPPQLPQIKELRFWRTNNTPVWLHSARPAKKRKQRGQVMFRIGKEEIDEVAKVIMSKQLFRSGDPEEGHLQEVERFEKELAQKIGTNYALCVSGGGTAALLCCLVGLGIGPGDEVLVSGYTFMASAVAILAAGAIPVIVEIDESLGVDPDDVELKIGPNTRAIMPVHMVGRPSDMDRICEIARKHNLKIVEDACLADGGNY